MTADYCLRATYNA